jgi:phosphopantetheinyl transferase
MQQFFVSISEKYYVSLWQTNHPEHLSNKDKSILNRKFILNFIQQLTNDPFTELNFNDNNKPILINKIYKSISISHTLNLLAIQLHKEPYAGIDIETERLALIKVQKKFLNDNEIELANNNLKTLCLLWTAKESVYKIHGTTNITPKDIQISQINLPYIYAQIKNSNFHEEYTLYSQSLFLKKNLTITYVQQKN